MDRKTSLKFACSAPGCGAELTAEMKDVGSRATCPTCGGVTAVPMPKVGLGGNARKEGKLNPVEGQNLGTKTQIEDEPKSASKSNPLIAAAVVAVLAGAGYFGVSRLMAVAPSADEAEATNEDDAGAASVEEEAARVAAKKADAASAATAASQPPQVPVSAPVATAGSAGFVERLDILLRRMEAAELTFEEMRQMEVTRMEADAAKMADTVAGIDQRLTSLKRRADDDYGVSLASIKEIVSRGSNAASDLDSALATIEQQASDAGQMAKAARLKKLKDVVVKSREMAELDEAAFTSFWDSEIERSD